METCAPYECSNRLEPESKFKDCLQKEWEKTLGKYETAANCRPAQTPIEIPSVAENLVNIREMQYATIERLLAMRAGLEGTNAEEVKRDYQNGLVAITLEIERQASDIAALLEDCRRLIGA